MPAVEHGSLAHAHEPKVPVADQVGGLIGWHKAATVVLNGECYAFGGEFNVHVHNLRFGVCGDVVQGRLDDTKRGQLQIGRQTHGLAAHRQLHRESMTLPHLLRQHFQRGDKAQILQIDRPQIADQAAQTDQLPVNQAREFVQPLARTGQGQRRGICAPSARAA